MMSSPIWTRATGVRVSTSVSRLAKVPSSGPLVIRALTRVALDRGIEAAGPDLGGRHRGVDAVGVIV
jgi:hypothetical protein